MKQIDEVVRQVFYEGQTVRSRYRGLGEVIMSGEDPRVRFLDGWECSVPGDTLTIVPASVYDAEIENQHNWERYLDLRLYGRTERPAKLLARQRFDLVAAMKQYAQAPPLPFVRPAPRDSVVFSFP